MASKCDEEKNSFTNQVVKDKIVFPLFLSNLMVFEFKRSIFDLFVFLAKKPGYKKVNRTAEPNQSILMFVVCIYQNVFEKITRQSAALRAGGHRLFAKRDISLTVHTSECLLSLQLRLLQSVSLTSLRKTVSR